MKIKKKLKRFLNKFIDIEIIDRIYSLKTPIIAWTFSCIIDLFVIALASKIFQQVLLKADYKVAIILSFLFIFVIFVRIYVIYILRKYASSIVHKNKTEEELLLVEKYINNRIYSENKNHYSNENFKESIINSTTAASEKFDLPIVAATAEFLFGSIGLLYLLKILGLNIFLINLPLILILCFISKINSRKIYNYGKFILSGTEEKLLSIDNVTEVSYELSALKNTHNILKIFNKKNKIYNNHINQVFLRTNLFQVIIESITLLIILFSLFSITFGYTDNSLEDSASILALLSRIVPSATRCIAYYSRIQFGIAPVKKLWALKQRETIHSL